MEHQRSVTSSKKKEREKTPTDLEKHIRRDKAPETRPPDPSKLRAVHLHVPRSLVPQTHLPVIICDAHADTFETMNEEVHESIQCAGLYDSI